MGKIIDVVEFEIGGALYALDICLSREIVEMIPITPVPRAPYHIAGIINLRGEVTNIIRLNSLLGLPELGAVENQKIIVLVPEASGGSNLGVIVDDVHSVIQVPEENIEQVDVAISGKAYIKGIIKTGSGDRFNEDENKEKNLIIWIDLQKIINDLVGNLEPDNE